MESRNTVESGFLARQWLLVAGALISAAVGVVLVIQAGLPQRAAFTGRALPGELPVAPELNALAPPFELPALDGEPISLSELRGSAVIINFWATWCGPCQIEMPELQALYELRRADGLRVLAINLGEQVQQVREWRDTLGLTYDILLDEEQRVAALYYLRGQPSTYVIGPNGAIGDIFYGPISRDRLQHALALHFQG